LFRYKARIATGFPTAKFGSVVPVTPSKSVPFVYVVTSGVKLRVVFKRLMY